MTVAVGDLAPPFTLSGIGPSGPGQYSLSDFQGRPVVLVFYPADNSPVCTTQLNNYTQHIDEFDGMHAQVLALSPQGLDSHESFANKEGGFAFPLLADSDKEVGKAYGILGPLGFYRRSIVVISETGKVSYVHRSITGVTFRPTDEIVRAIESKQ
jgi:thioredoxin-dependent peroxiredoxin